MKSPLKIKVASTKKRLQRKLLKPGWAGSLSNSEVVFIRQELERSPRLRMKWGYLGATLGDLCIPPSTIRRIAMHGVV